jgi:hypothetical protein
VDDNPFDVFQSSSSAPVNHSSHTPASAMQISRTVTPSNFVAGHHVQEPQPQPQSHTSPTTTPVPIVVDPPTEHVRTPTPIPVPEFVVDRFRLSKLKDSLREDTADLSVEELEQLRATCLGCVWRHRTAWDRRAVLEELETVVGDFLREVGADSEEEVERV